MNANVKCEAAHHKDWLTGMCEEKGLVSKSNATHKC